MSTSAVLKEAWSAVQEADLPEKIHEIAFKEAVRLIAPPVSGAPAQQQGQAGKRGDGGKPSNVAGSSASMDSGDQAQGTITMTEDDLVAKVATGTGVDAELLDNLIHVDQGVLHLNLPGIKLGNNNADRTRTIASIFTVVRSFGLDEDDTSVELVRDEAQRLKCYDPANFSSQLKVLQGQGYVIKGSGSNRRIQVKGPGIAEFPKLVGKLAGDS
jgi:nitrate reductase alpha subunit